MAFTPTFGTGFEMGSVAITPNTDQASCTIEETVVKTGSYSCELYYASGARPFIRWPHSGAYLDFAVWVWPANATDPIFKLTAVLDDSSTVELRRRTSVSTTWDLYIDGALIESGTVATDNEVWQHVQCRIFIDNSGTVQSKVDGVSDIDYSGDTQPGASAEIEWFRIDNYETLSAHYRARIDDVVYGSGGWPGDIRFDGLLPTGDVETEWTPSAGVDHYALVDERPPSDADYVSAGSPALRDVYSGGDWSGTAKTPQFLMQWARAKKDSAGTRQLKFIVSSDSTESAGSLFDLTTAYAYYKRALMTDPSTGSPWTEGAIDAVLFGMESG